MSEQEQSNSRSLLIDLIKERHSWDMVLKHFQETKEGQKEHAKRRYEVDYGRPGMKGPGGLPLHIVLRHYYRAPIEVVQALLHVYPEGIKEYDDVGLLPIHIALMDHSSYEIIQLLLKAFPTTTTTTTNTNTVAPPPHEQFFTLIHGALHKLATLDVIELLLRYDPDAIHTQDKDGNLPIHIAAGRSDYSTVTDITQMLIKRYPKGLQQTNNKGLLPIHIACQHVIHVKEAIPHWKVLIDAYPESVLLTCEHIKYRQLPTTPRQFVNKSKFRIHSFFDMESANSFFDMTERMTLIHLCSFGAQHYYKKPFTSPITIRMLLKQKIEIERNRKRVKRLENSKTKKQKQN